MARKASDAMNQQVCLAAYPSGAVQADCFRLRRVPVPEPADGEVLVRNIYLSCDPYMRGRMSGHTGYAAGFALDEPVPARVVGQVAQSRHPDFADGDFVWDFLRWENFTLVRDVATCATSARRWAQSAVPSRYWACPGRTAEVGMLDITQVRAGETVFVSAASGAVGSVAGQLARAAGARVIGSAGTDAKVRHCLDRPGL
ncbi:MAG: NADP-dependent oxidoreductase [Pseudomonadales bacterium]